MSLFKQICSATLMEDDMLKAQIKVVDIQCDLELIYPPALFEIMIHLVIHLPLEALEGGPILPRWMFPFERYMKKSKGYVRNKAKPKGSIAEGYVAEEALTFSSYYFRDVTTKFNHPDRNVDPPPITCQFQVFRLVCKPIGLRSVIRFDAQELKKVKWYAFHNSPEIDTYHSQFKRYRGSSTQEYPSLIDTFFVAHTVNEVFTRDEDRLIYEEMRRLEATGTYTDDEINRLARRDKQRGHIPGVGKFKSAGASGSDGCGDDEESADDQEDEDEDGDDES
nr:hypothetical protein [Tanacetum cinerariifolium]